MWDPKELNGPVPDLSTLPRGKVSHVPQPKYIIIRAKGKLIPIVYCNAQLDKENPKIKTTNYRSHPVDLLFSVTYHKLQGLNMDALVLSINKHPNKKLRVTLPSLYVGASRVHSLDQLRVLPFWEEDVEYLTSLKRDPLLKLWFENYSEDGIWKSDGLQSFEAELQMRVKQRLALVDDLSFWTGKEAKRFAKDLDLDAGSLNKQPLLNLLKPFYDEGRRSLTANGNLLLMRFRSDLILELRKQESLGKLSITAIKSFAKRLGFDMAQKISRKNLEKSLERMMIVGVPVTDMKQHTFKCGNVHEPEKPVCGSDCHVQALGNKVQHLVVDNSKGKQSSVVPDEKDLNTYDDIAKSLLPGSDSQPTCNVHGENMHGIVKQICSIIKNYNSLNTTGTITLPDGHEYDRIFNVGGGNCYFHAVCQGLEFFGISIDHIELRTKVGQWLQNADNAMLMEMKLGLRPLDLYSYLKLYPGPPGGWFNYLIGMSWKDWGVHVELLGEWVGAM